MRIDPNQHIAGLPIGEVRDAMRRFGHLDAFTLPMLMQRLKQPRDDRPWSREHRWSDDLI